MAATDPGAATPAVEATFRDVAGLLCSGVVVLSTVAGGLDHGMTATALSPVSFAPPLVLACLANTSRFRAGVAISGTWGVSILPESARDVAAWFASRRRTLRDQFRGLPCVRGAHTGAPLLSDALATFECSLHAVHPGGDHSILVGAVLSANVGRGGDPLLHYRQAYYHPVHAGVGGGKA